MYIQVFHDQQISQLLSILCELVLGDTLQESLQSEYEFLEVVLVKKQQLACVILIPENSLAITT